MDILTVSKKKNTQTSLNTQTRTKVNCHPQRTNPTGPQKQWNEFTNVDGKLLLLKTSDIGLRKSTNKSKMNRKSTPKKIETQPPTKIAKPKARKHKLKILPYEAPLTPRRQHLRRKLLSRPTSTPTLTGTSPLPTQKPRKLANLVNHFETLEKNAGENLEQFENLENRKIAEK